MDRPARRQGYRAPRFPPRISLELALSAGAWGLALAVAASSVYAIVRFTHAVPFADQWDLTARLLGGAGLDIGRFLAALWEPHNEHRLVTFNLVNAVDVALFGGANRFNSTALIAAMAASVALILGILRRAGLAGHTLWLWAAPIALAAVFNGVQTENLTWALGLQWHLAHVFVLGALLPLVDLAASEPPRWRRLAASVASAVLASVSSANGLLAWPLVVLFAWSANAPARVIVAYGAAAVATVTVWRLGAQTVLDPATLLATVAATPLDVASYMARFAGSLWYWADRPLQGLSFAIASGYAVVLGAAALLAALLFRRPALTPVERALAVIVLFAVGTAFLSALGRLGFSVNQALAPRYASTGGLLWAAVLIGVMTARWPAGRTIPGMATARAAVALWLLAALLLYQPKALATIAGRHAERDRGAVALSVGVADDEMLRPLHPDSARLPALAAALRDRGASIFAGAPATYMGAAIGRDFAPAPAGACPGVAERLDELRRVADGGLVGLRAQGWAWDRAADAPLATILIADEQGVVIGLGRAGLPRPDLSAASERRAAAAGWMAHIKLGTGTLTAYGLTRAGRLCELAGDGG